jgi:hypothetical protein
MSLMHRAPYRIPNWNPVLSTVSQSESLFYKVNLKLPKFTGIKGLIGRI